MRDRGFRRDPRDFSRGGPLQPELLTTLLLYMVADGNRRGYRHVLRAFWDDAISHGLPLPCDEPISAPSFCEARHKITVDLLRELLYEITGPSASGHDIGQRRWRGRRVFAVDGTKINLQRDPDLERAFGVPNGAHCPQLLLSVLVDVCARIPMDLEISGFASSEREHLARMLTGFEGGDILVLDRGYPSYDLFQSLSDAGADFLVRVSGSHSFPVVDEFRESGATDEVRTLYTVYGSDEEEGPQRVRLIRIEGPNDEESFFITSLAKAQFSRADLAELYHMRWEAEEFFKLLKSSYVGQGQYRSKSASGIIQEIHASVLFLAIARLCTSVAAGQIEDPEQMPSQKGAVLALAAFLTRILLDPDQRRACAALTSAIERIARTPEKRRPGRSAPRRSFQPVPRWGPRGRWRA